MIPDPLAEAGWDESTAFPRPGAGALATEVSAAMLDALVSVWLAGREGTADPPTCCLGQYWADLGDEGILCVDNRDGDCFVEQFRSGFEAKRWLAEGDVPLSALTQEELRDAWADLGDVAVDDDGRLLGPWLGYEEGTDRVEIWHDFDEAFVGGVASLMFPGGNPPLAATKSPAPDDQVTRDPSRDGRAAR